MNTKAVLRRIALIDLLLALGPGSALPAQELEQQGLRIRASLSPRPGDASGDLLLSVQVTHSTTGAPVSSEVVEASLGPRELPDRQLAWLLNSRDASVIAYDLSTTPPRWRGSIPLSRVPETNPLPGMMVAGTHIPFIYVARHGTRRIDVIDMLSDLRFALTVASPTCRMPARTPSPSSTSKRPRADGAHSRGCLPSASQLRRRPVPGALRRGGTRKGHLHRGPKPTGTPPVLPARSWTRRARRDGSELRELSRPGWPRRRRGRGRGRRYHPCGLTKPYPVTLPGGRRRGPYTDRLLGRAITEGLDPAGQELQPVMPRWNLHERDLADLLAYLKRLGHEPRPGVTDNLIRIGVVLLLSGPSANSGEAVRALLTALVGDLNAEILTLPPGMGPRLFFTNHFYPGAAAGEEFVAFWKRHRLPETSRSLQMAAYAAARVLVEGLRITGRDLSRQRLVESLEGLQGFETGVTGPISYLPGQHVGANLRSHALS